MKNFIVKNNLYLITALGIIVAIITIINWSAMPVLQRMTGSTFSIVYAEQHNLMHPVSWLFSFIYMAIALLSAQQIVVRMSGMKYTDFLKNVRATIFTNRK